MNKRCRDVMTKDPTCCGPEDSIQSAAQLMKEQDVGSIPVCYSRETKRIVGILTDRDITIKVVAEGRDLSNTRVLDVMTTEVFTCRPDDDLESALQTMEGYQVRRIPVVGENRHVLGIISQADIATRLRIPKKTAKVVGEISKPGAQAA